MRQGVRWGLNAVALLLFAAVAVMPSSAIALSCSNEQFRTGLSAALPDCRAYELVTPPDTDGRQLTPISNLPYNLFPTELASPDGNSILFMAPGTPLREPQEPNGTADLYEAGRLEGVGWRTIRRLSPSGSQAVFPEVGGISEDHRYAFYRVGPVQGREGGSLADGGLANYVGSPDGSFALIGIGGLGTERLAKGRFISDGGQHVIFMTGGEGCEAEGCPVDQLEPDAPPSGTGAVYDRNADGTVTHVVSLLPGEITPEAGENAVFQGASSHATSIAFKIGEALYVRVNGAKTEPVTSTEATFAGLSADGGKMFYVKSGNLFEFDVGDETTHVVNSTEDAEVVNVSADGSHVYFISRSQLDGSKGTAGEPNLYVWTGDTEAIEYIATVSPNDLTGIPALNNWTTWVTTPSQSEAIGPGADSSRSTGDGNVLVFESHAQLTGYENQEHTELYRYDDRSKEVLCVSCNPSMSPATADARLEAVDVQAIRPLMVVRNLSEDGRRVFFETSEALVARDTDEISDIYEWEEGSSPGEATLSLISSGKSPSYTFFGQPLLANQLLAVTPQGDDVVFSAREPLLPSAGAGGSTAIYDARVGGGFAEEPIPQNCLGESCQPSTQAPVLEQAKSEQFVGRGNVKPRRRCRGRGRAAGHRRCRGRKSHRKRQVPRQRRGLEAHRAGGTR